MIALLAYTTFEVSTCIKEESIVALFDRNNSLEILMLVAI